MTTSESVSPESARSADSPENQRLLRLAKLFDLRTFIGALFTIFGVLVTIQGAFVSDADIKKAAGIRLGLWVGLIMLAVGLGFIGWMLAKPPELPPARPAEDDDSTPESGRHGGGH
jgi:hypothetical protein